MSKVYFDIFTDGSSYIGDEYESSSAYLITCMSQNVCEGGKYHIGGTNQVGETYAVLMALKRVNKLIDKFNGKDIKFIVRIFSDSSFTKDSLTKWILSWKKQGKDKTWINSSGGEVACQDTFKKIYYKYLEKNDKFEVEFYLIRGHIGQKIKFDDAHKKFMKKNDIEISKEDFKTLVEGNHEVDRLAEKVRLEKLYKYENSFSLNGGKLLWEVSLKLEKQRIRIKSRK